MDRCVCVCVAWVGGHNGDQLTILENLIFFNSIVILLIHVHHLSFVIINSCKIRIQIC